MPFKGATSVLKFIQHGVDGAWSVPRPSIFSGIVALRARSRTFPAFSAFHEEKNEPLAS